MLKKAAFTLSHKILRALSTLGTAPVDILVWYLDIARLTMDATVGFVSSCLDENGDKLTSVH